MLKISYNQIFSFIIFDSYQLSSKIIHEYNTIIYNNVQVFYKYIENLFAKLHLVLFTFSISFYLLLSFLIFNNI